MAETVVAYRIGKWLLADSQQNLGPSVRREEMGEGQQGSGLQLEGLQAEVGEMVPAWVTLTTGCS